ncbi:PilN domain-containing protein [Halomonas sp. I1]|uniref:PilN domain-containing protein n=1 Tax=Halomonas sp. I1 TaxID=393536 RepID=UPI0028E03BE1|nr:PilN domain-containing protein [Halomonas sp. I1]MDT8894438.1 PilN domain-containing protein [Halomonas sp. I1]
MSVEINLLPWRETRRERRRRRWRVMLLCALLIGVATGCVVDRHYAARMDAQQRRHALIERHVEALEPAVLALERQQERMTELEQRLAALRKRLDSRTDTLRTFHGLVATLVEGVHYSTLEQRERLLALSGSADSHRRIAAQLQALEASPIFEAPSLSEVEPLPEGWHFRLSVVLAGQREGAS